MSKKWLVVFLCVFVLIAGCNNATSSSSKGANSGDQDAVKIGIYSPLTGASSQMGIALRNGAALAVEQLNNNGGVLGKQIKLIEYDDKGSPEQAVKNVTKMIEVDHVHAIVGSLFSGNVLASAPVSEKAQIPQIGTGTSKDYLEKGFKYLYRALPNNTWSNIQLAKKMKEMDLSNIGVLYRNDELGNTGSKDIMNRITENGLTVTVDETYQPGDTDYTGQLTKIINSGIDGIVVYGVAEEAGPAMKQIRQLGYEGPIFGPEPFATPEAREIAGDAANGAIFATTYLVPEKPEDSATELLKAFNTAYVSKYNEMPAVETAYRGYDAVNIIAHAIAQANSLDGTAIRDAIQNITDLEGLAGTFNFKGKNGEGMEKSNLFTIVDGKVEMLQ